ncbi:class I SAM-dependent methyltransferase [Microbacteriaceae bacterium VKM Ac-2855]|nr:class I SAM-dependent methyltransferase [Microbacteriaceae bacterium VKM Ac-2855]
MAAEHYFTSAPDSEYRTRRIQVRINGHEVAVTTAGGVFSPEHIDTGTKVLLATVPEPPRTGDLLDLGCGWGPIALSLASASPEATVWAVDVNRRALDLVRRNADELGLANVNAVVPEDVPDGVRFAALWSNPPIRVGKAELHAMLERWLPRLEPEAEAWLVVQRNLGSDSLHRWIAETLPGTVTIERADTDKGFRVFRTVRL